MALVTYRNFPMSSALCIIVALMSGTIVGADECKRSFGNVGPVTYSAPNQTCFASGDNFEFPVVLNWDDGTYSAYNLQVNTQIVLGSCCSAFKSSFYGTGVVASGRFSGEKVIVSYEFNDERQICNGCQSSAGLSRVTGGAMLSIGTKELETGLNAWAAQLCCSRQPLTQLHNKFTAHSC